MEYGTIAITLVAAFNSGEAGLTKSLALLFPHSG
jgi:hypothetical protein